MDYFTRAVESLLGQGGRFDSSLLKLDEVHWTRAVEESGYVAARINNLRGPSKAKSVWPAAE